MRCQRSLHSDRESASARLAPPRPAHFEGSGGAQARAKAGQPRQRLAYSRSRRDAASGRQGASWGRGATITQPSRRSQGRFSGFFFYIPPPPIFGLPSLHSHLVNYLPGFSQIYQHLAFSRRQTRLCSPSPLGRNRDKERDSFLKGSGSCRRRRPPYRGRLSRTGAFSSVCVSLGEPSNLPQAVSPCMKQGTGLDRTSPEVF